LDERAYQAIPDATTMTFGLRSTPSKRHSTPLDGISHWAGDPRTQGFQCGQWRQQRQQS